MGWSWRSSSGSTTRHLRRLCGRGLGLFLAGLLAGVGALPAFAQKVTASAVGPVVLDEAVAVVNKRLILASDVDDEIQLSVLEPNVAGQGPLTRREALDRLISRTLIEQQIRKEDAEAAEPTEKQLDARLMEIRSQAPACVRADCASEAGWEAFLAKEGLTERRVEAYFRYRMEILRFIEQRFRPGIRITQPQIETYYRDTLLPQYAAGEAVPPLRDVAPRIEEILLEQQVNILFDQWLDNLRQQGDVEILDPALAEPANKATKESAGVINGVRP
jgi:peptidyl-prolyl cis-trans isomerase SurA